MTIDLHEIFGIPFSNLRNPYLFVGIPVTSSRQERSVIYRNDTIQKSSDIPSQCLQTRLPQQLLPFDTLSQLGMEKRIGHCIRQIITAFEYRHHWPCRPWKDNTYSGIICIAKLT
jgi:hypothetical protein